MTFFVFSLLAFLSINWLIFYWTLRLLHWQTVTAVVLSLTFSFSYGGAYNLGNYIHVGYYELLLILFGFIAIYHERFDWLLTSIAVGSFVKETVIILLPLYVAYSFVVGWSAQIEKRLLALSAVYLAIYFFLRSGILFHDTSGIATYAHFYTPDYLRLVVESWGGPLSVTKNILFAFMLAWLSAALGFVCCADRRARVMALLIPLAIAQILLATDVERMTIVAFPAILLLSGLLFQRIRAVEQITFAALNIPAFLLYNQSNFFAPFFGAAFGAIVLWCIAFHTGQHRMG